MIDYTQILTVGLPSLAAVCVGLFKLIAYWLRGRWIMAANAEQLAALKTMEPPSFIIRSGGPALVLLGLGSGLAAYHMAAKPDAQAQVARSCITDKDCARGETCVAKTCTMQASSPTPSADLRPQSSVRLADCRAPALPVNTPPEERL